MKQIIVLIALIGLAACAKVETQAKASNPLNVSHGTAVDSRLSSPDNTARLEAKIDRLEGLLSRLVNEQKAEQSKLVEYNRCTDTCRDVPPDYLDEKLPWGIQFKTRNACFERCREIEPETVKATSC